MRLNGKREILMYFGRSVSNRRAWRRIRERYGSAIWYAPTGRAWARSEDLDAIDQQQGMTVASFRATHGPYGRPEGGRVGSWPPELRKMFRQLYGSAMAKQEKGT